jgi:N-methylhydantoinase A
MAARVSLDIGGTFTDLVYTDEKSQTRTAKVLSTPPILTLGVMEALRIANLDPRDISVFVHGTTQGLNAILERKGAKVALITTKGFRDTYVIARGNRIDMYNLHFKKPSPLIDREHIYEVSERISSNGDVVKTLDLDDLDRVIKEVSKGEYTSVAIVFLHSYINGTHERQVKARFKELLSDVSVSISCEVSPEWREYERTSTTVMSAYISPIMDTYLTELESQLQERELSTPVYITSSNGGVISASMARNLAARTIFSGPVGGAVGARQLSRDLNIPNIIAADIGGTSFDVSIVREKSLSIINEFELSGLPVIAPTVDVHTIGAGGGSLIMRDSAGRLRVGPQSAGAIPGPICYGRSGEVPTVTDANVLLGRIPAIEFFGGELKQHMPQVMEAFSKLGSEFNLGGEELAEQALEVVNFRMSEAIRELTVERGLDPRDFTLCMFGGAGGLHATALADELEISRILIPRFPGNFSAWGMLQSGIRHDFVKSYFRRLSSSDLDLIQQLKLIDSELEELARSESLDISKMMKSHSLDLRYEGQEYSMTIVIDANSEVVGIRRAFNEAYKKRYGHSNDEDEIEVVCVRGSISYEWSKIPLPPISKSHIEGTGLKSQVYLQGQLIECEIWNRESLPKELMGPVIIVESTGTTFIAPGWCISDLPGGHLSVSKVREAD